MNHEESARCFAVLESSYLSDRPKALLTYAKENGLLDSSITAPNGDTFPATQYCMELYTNALLIGEDTSETLQDSYQIVSLLLTMERMRHSVWNFGSETRYKVASAGIKITRNEVNALLAQQGDFSNKAYKPDKAALMSKNLLAVAIYAAELVTLCGSLHGKMLPGKQIPKELYDKFNGCWKDTPKESLEAMMITFCPAFLGNQEPLLKPFMDFLLSSDFYMAPASTKYHSSHFAGLANHCCQTLARLIAIAKPQTDAELGKLVLLVVAHDLCKVNVYEKYFTNDKINGPALRTGADGSQSIDKYQTKYWSDGSAYHYKEVQKYRFNDMLPQGHGQKSLNMLMGFFHTAITEDMAAAVDGHMRDYENNPLCDYQMMQYPLCQYLHIADTMASLLDEAEGQQ